MNRRAIFKVVNRVRTRLQFEQLIQGLAWWMGVTLLVSLICSYLLTQVNFSSTALLWSRLLLAAVLLFSFLRFLLIPQLRRPSIGLIARFLEERHPQLQDRLSTAVELSESSRSTDPLVQRLVLKDAWSRFCLLPQPRLYRWRATGISLALLLLSGLVFAGLFWVGPPAYRYTLARLVHFGPDKELPSLYSIQVSPGNTTVTNRTDVEVRARLQGFNSDQVRLWVKYQDQLDWDNIVMQIDDRGNQLLHLLFDVRETLSYYVEAEGVRSETYHIQIAQIPRVEKLKITLNYPDHTALPDETIIDQGDIRAVEGTRAQLRLQSDQPVMAGKIKLEESGEILLETVDETTLRATLHITQNDFYRIHLQDGTRFWNPASGKYSIRALEDQEPTLSFTRPGRDLKVTNIEEVFTELQAEDDYAVSKLRVLFSINGGKERSVRLDTPAKVKFLAISHTFLLEEFGLEPGDFVSYYGEASDSVSKSVTDLYFLEVQPYDRAYYQSQQSGAPGGFQSNPRYFLASRKS